jgi:hypothetical protein
MIDAEFISVPEWGRRMGVSKESAYKAARLGAIPGCFAIGRLYRVNWSAFVERSALTGGHSSPEEIDDASTPAVNLVGSRTGQLGQTARWVPPGHR